VHIILIFCRSYAFLLKGHIDNEFKPNTINRKILSLKYFMQWGWDTKKMEYRFPLPKLVKQSSITARWLDRLEQNTLGLSAT